MTRRLISFGIFAHEDIGAYLNGLDMLSVAVEGDARHTVERSLLSNIAGVGDDATGMEREITKLEIAQRLDDAHTAAAVDIGKQLLHHLLRLAAQRCHDGHTTRLLDHRLQHRLQVKTVGKECLAVEGEDNIFALVQLHGVEHLGALPAVVIEAEVIDEDISHHIDTALLRSFAVGDTVVAHACGEEEVGESVDDEAVDFLGG